MGKNGVRVSRYFQRNSSGAAESAIKSAIKVSTDTGIRWCLIGWQLPVTDLT
jgi:hypothetical protein